MTQNPSQRFAEHAARLTWSDLTERAVQAAKRVVLDWLGNVYAGAETATGRLLAEVALQQGPGSEALLVGHDRYGAAMTAALVNGGCAHIVEFDDIYKNAIYHPAAPTIAAALAVAQRQHLDGRRLITAIAAGYDVGNLIGEAVQPSHYKFWHTTGTVGTFGAAAAAGNLLGLGAEQMAWALGNAGSQAAGLWQFIDDGQTMTKPLHPGKAASNGVLAALLAAKGFNGATRILEGEKGFCNATSQGWSFDKVLAKLGKEHTVEQTTFKAYPSCGHTHPTIDAALAIMKAHGVRAADVERVKVRTYDAALSVASNPAPTTTHQAKFSIQYCLALALRHGGVALAGFATERLGDPETRALMRRIEVVDEKELSAVVPGKRPAIVELTTKAGATHRHRVDYRKGDPENPLTAEELERKFLDLSRSRLGEAEARAVVGQIGRLEQVADVAALLAR
jgi:2-methylcitrate dehydratase PrpD